MGESRPLNRLAAQQHGAFSLGQVRRLGFDRSAVWRRVTAGQWIRLDDRVYAFASSVPSWERSVQAALLSRPDSVLSHSTAAHLHGLNGFSKGRPVLLVPRGSNVRSGVARVVESDQFDQISPTTIRGFRVTTVPETILILARDERGPRLAEVFDDALISGKLDLGAMSRILDREAGRRTPGTPDLRRLVSARRRSAPTRSSSYLEGMMEFILNDDRLPSWEREYTFALDGVVARVDFFIPVSSLVLEGDGRNWHMKRSDFETDRRRDNALAARGIQVLRFTYEMLKSEPDKCLEQAVSAARLRAA